MRGCAGTGSLASGLTLSLRSGEALSTSCWSPQDISMPGLSVASLADFRHFVSEQSSGVDGLVLGDLLDQRRQNRLVRIGPEAL